MFSEGFNPLAAGALQRIKQKMAAAEPVQQFSQEEATQWAAEPVQQPESFAGYAPEQQVFPGNSSGGGKGMGGCMAPQMGGGAGAGTGNELVMQIKLLQRSDPGAKEQWWAYCDQMGGGVRDPAKHNEEFLNNFITQFTSGATFEVPQGGASYPEGMVSGQSDSALCGVIKGCQARSSGFCEAWKMYTTHFGKGINDPAKHDVDFLTNFLDHCGASAMMVPPRATIGNIAPNAGRGGGGGDGDRPAKRIRGDATLAGLNPEHLETVQRVKNYQKSSEEAKQIWWNFCDTDHSGKRDPARHSMDVLMGFCVNYGVP